MKIRFSRVKAMDNHKSKKVIEQLYQKRPDLKHNRINLFRLRLEEKKYTEADKLALELLSESTNDLPLILNLSKFYSAANQFEKALSIIDKIPQGQLPLPLAIRKMELLTNINSNKSDYVDLVTKIGAANSSRREVLLCQANISYVQKKYQEVVSKCSLILGQHPRDIKAMQLLSNSMYLMGDINDAMKILDFENLMGTFFLQTENEHIREFNNSLYDELNENKNWVQNPSIYTVTNGDQLDQLGSYDWQYFIDLEKLIYEKVEEYIMNVSKTNHKYFKNSSEKLHLQVNSWAVRLFKSGHQSPHIHARGWISGVYYIQIPDKNKSNSKEGAIEFGIGNHDHSFTSLYKIHPEEGMLILFPSYILHRTIPFESDQSRVCISFDFTPINN